ncbi:hypothetical protein [Pseudohongiella acticola]|jgi:exopolyphosphatase/pppGpp-phosphohydrolase|uniref:Ppx/GppA phosphatase family protein n=1 Tax=Pseudohongiella acticola TaxID=1524254 RepID=UPI0030EF904F
MYACIDLGSNSFHLLIARWHEGSYDIVERFSEKVQLGEGLVAGGMITPAAFERGLSCLDTFAKALARYPIEHCWAVGTNALRTAANSEQFLAGAREKGFVIDVVPGLDEAALVYAGVISALQSDDVSRLIIDIGGGSTELVVGAGQHRLQSHSMAIGCISWRDLWFSDLPQSEAALSQRLDDAAEASAGIFASVAGELATTPWQEAYASSGTAKMLSAVCAYKSQAQRTTPGVSLASLQALKTDVMRTVLEPGYSLPGLKNGRRELILPGWAVLNGFMTACQVSELQFSPSALREGMLHYLAQASIRGESPLHVLRAQ